MGMNFLTGENPDEATAQVMAALMREVREQQVRFAFSLEQRNDLIANVHWILGLFLTDQLPEDFGKRIYAWLDGPKL